MTRLFFVVLPLHVHVDLPCIKAAVYATQRASLSDSKLRSKGSLCTNGGEGKLKERQDKQFDEEGEFALMRDIINGDYTVKESVSLGAALGHEGNLRFVNALAVWEHTVRSTTSDYREVPRSVNELENLLTMDDVELGKVSRGASPSDGYCFGVSYYR